MSIIPVQAYEHPDVKRALEKADDIIENWLERGLYHGQKEDGQKVCSGWAYVSLRESIAYELCESAGIDMEDICMEADDWPPSETMGDGFGRMARYESKKVEQLSEQ